MGEVAQSCLTLCDPVDCSLPGCSVHGILQARILEWVAISFLRGSSRPSDQTWISHIAGRCFTLWATREAQYMGDVLLKRFKIWKGALKLMQSLFWVYQINFHDIFQLNEFFFSVAKQICAFWNYINKENIILHIIPFILSYVW